MAVRPKWDLDDPGEEALAGGFYSGDVPPVGTYRCRVVGARVKQDKNHDDRVNFWIEIVESKKPKKQYSGYRFYDGQSIAKREIQQRIWKQIVHALGVSWQDFLRKTVLDGKTSQEDTVDLIKFGGVAVDKLPDVVIACKQTTYDGNLRLEAARWMPLAEDAEDDEDEEFDDEDEEFDDEDEDGEEPPF